MDETCEQISIGQNSPMTITEYLISIHEDWKVVLSDEPEKQLTLKL